MKKLNGSIKNDFSIYVQVTWMYFKVTAIAFLIYTIVSFFIDKRLVLLDAGEEVLKTPVVVETTK